MTSVLNRLTQLFPLWAIIFSLLAWQQPQLFNSFQSSIVPLLSVVMFGMGLTLHLSDFSYVLQMPRLILAGIALGMAAVVAFSPAISWAADVVTIAGNRPVKVRPHADGTIVDGGSFGDFDGVPDDADWAFDDTGYDGAITLATETPESSLEHRVVWEYTVWGLGLEPPIVATLVFTQLNTINHTFVHLPEFPFKTLDKITSLHAAHHVDMNHGNFATLTMLYDWLFGTLEAPVHRTAP